MNFPIRLFIKALLPALLWLNVAAGRADDCLPKPGDRLVYDLADFFPPQARQRLEQSLRRYYHDSALQMVLIVTDTLCARAIAMYANEIGQAWGVGVKGRDDGIVIVMVPKRPGHRGQVFIAPGRGIQGTLPDAVVKRIIDRVMIPAFREGAYVEGFEQAFAVMARAVGGRPPFPQEAEGPLFPVMIVLGAFSLFVLIGLFQAWAAVGAAEAKHQAKEKADARQAAVVLTAFSAFLLLGWLILMGLGMAALYGVVNAALAWWGYRAGRRHPDRYKSGTVSRQGGGGMPWIIGGGGRGFGGGGGGISFGGGGFNGGGAGGSW